MKEIEELRALADEDFKRWQEGRESELSLYEKTKTHLDRAIALAQQNDTLARENRKLVLAAWKERDKAIAAGKALRKQIERRRRKGYKLMESEEQALADTAWLEDR